MKKLEHNTNDKNKSDNQNANPAAETTLIFALQNSAIDPNLNPNLKPSAINLDFDKFCTIYIINKSTKIVKCHKSMTSANKKLEEVNVNL